MKTIRFLWLGLAWLAASQVCPAESFDDAMRQQAATYRERQRNAADLLNQTRERIAKEKAPLLQQVRAAEDRLLHAESEARRIETGRESAGEQRRLLLKEIDELTKTTGYAATLGHDGLIAVQDSLAPGEAQTAAEQISDVLARIDRASSANRGQSAVDAAELMLRRIERELGGFAERGQSLAAGDSLLHSGAFAHVGPETYFRSDDGLVFGTVRSRETAAYPTTHHIDSWTSAEATALFTTGAGAVPADPSGGKALRLAETRGTMWAHIQKGGVVAYAILAAGLLALAMVIQKTTEVLRMGVDTPDAVAAFLEAVREGDVAGASAAATRLRGCTAQLCAAGLEHRDAPKAALEEVLQSVLLEQRLHYERRLPLLAVIATAAPLMGLLGTVVGMVRTFALITVFGTGNAGKLSSGISEVLVATELGLLVAIPALVAHGFLAHRVQKNLGTLERYALQLVTATESGRTDRIPVTASK